MIGNSHRISWVDRIDGLEMLVFHLLGAHINDAVASIIVRNSGCEIKDLDVELDNQLIVPGDALHDRHQVLG